MNYSSKGTKNTKQLTDVWIGSQAIKFLPILYEVSSADIKLAGTTI